MKSQGILPSGCHRLSFVRVFSCRQGNFVLKIIYQPALFLLIHGQNNHPAWSVTITLVSEKSVIFYTGGWQA